MVGERDLEELSYIFQIPIATGTINRGSVIIASGCLVNDSNGYVWFETTSSEITLFDDLLKLTKRYFR